ncbi:MAG TPA: hypothetical protein VNS31_06475 [Ramlibacter sp.]|nr:hypothetical protein [Ramlibacter sp.]
MTAAQAAGIKRVIRWGAALALGVGYSFLAHRASVSATPDLGGALVAILPLVGLAVAMAWRSTRRVTMIAACLAACVALFAVRDWMVAHYNGVFLLQHAGMYALLCVAFGRTLQAGSTPMITGFARIVHGTLSPALVSYTRSATWAWSIYFGAVTAASLLLFWLAPIAIWSYFANLLSPVLLVLMFAGEYAVRCCILPAADRAGPLESIRAYRRASSSRAAQQP